MNVLIVDDEAPARDRMRRMVGAVDGFSVIGEAGDGVTALEQCAALRPDLVLLDIDMPELDGLGVAAALGERGPAIVFVTAYDEHALKAFELAAVDYLVKPVAKERLAAALEKVRTRREPQIQLAGRPTRMAVKCGAKFIVFDPLRVCAVISRDHYSAILVDGKELLADDPLDELCRRFGTDGFLRVHRGAMINVAFLRELVHEGDRRYIAVLSDPEQTRVPISRERLPSVKAALGID